jgi:L-seryl-tRNA(Ser) seleniumtransferase
VKATDKTEQYRKLPSLDEMLRREEVAALIAREGHPAVADAAREVLARLREAIHAETVDAEGVNLAVSGLPAAVERQLRQAVSYSLQPVINATGVILHTNLGRAPLARSALRHIERIAANYSNLEFNLDAGERGKRDVHADRLFQKLLSGEASGQTAAVPNEISTIVVNNNAAAVLLALNTLADGGEVVVSRGELVEIGGSFRIPDVMAKSGAVLREVGTTNRTRISDYAKVISERTKLLLRVHRSNFQITGFTEQPSLEDLVQLARKHDIPLLHDLGSGALFDLRSVGIGGEPCVMDSLRAGVDVVTYSGDKLLGGPQAGVLSGRTELIKRMRANSLFRALRVDKLVYAALEATLLAYVKGDHDSIPALRMMRLRREEIDARAKAIAEDVDSPLLCAEVIDGESVVGGGAAPSAVLPTRLISLTAKNFNSNELAARLRRCGTPIIARVEDGRVLLDLRTVFPEQDECIAEGLRKLQAEALVSDMRA